MYGPTVVITTFVDSARPRIDDASPVSAVTSGSCSAAGLIREARAKTPDEIRELMSGNICRCGAYPNIVAAIEQAMQTGKERAQS